MDFIWDETKNRSNRCKHGLSFESVKEVFKDPYLLSWLDDRFDNDEERWIGLGCIDSALIVVVSHTFRSEQDDQEIIRLISARKASKKEQEIYWKYRTKNCGYDR